MPCQSRTVCIVLHAKGSCLGRETFPKVSLPRPLPSKGIKEGGERALFPGIVLTFCMYSISFSMNFDWDESKNSINRDKHGVSFEDAQEAFFDPHRLIRADTLHSNTEPRFFCYGMVADRVLTVRFNLHDGSIRIFGAAWWWKGAWEYENR